MLWVCKAGIIPVLLFLLAIATVKRAPPRVNIPENVSKLSDLQRVAVLISFSGQGGVERMVMNLVREMAKTPNLHIDLLLIRADGPHLNNIPKNINVVKLKARHTLSAIPELTRYLRYSKPEALLAAKDRAGRAAVMAKLLSRSSCRLVLRLGTNLSRALADKHPVQKWLRVAPMRFLYKHIEMVVGVSEGVRLDTQILARLPSSKTTVIRNPVITAQMLSAAQEHSPHAWLDDTEVPVIMGIGRLSYQKNFLGLLEAFAELVKRREARLIILGDGKDRLALEQRVAELGLEEKVLLPGFQENPYRWLARATVFVLSSRWEGSPNVLTEALGLGVQVVAADCPSGPDEVLAGGELAPLVPVEDSGALLQGIQQVLESPVDVEVLKAAVAEYRPKVSAKNYLAVMGISEAS